MVLKNKFERNIASKYLNAVRGSAAAVLRNRIPSEMFRCIFVGSRGGVCVWN